MTLNLPEKSARKSGDGDTLKRRLLGAAVLIALAVIFLPLLLDGSGSESRFRRVEQLRTQPPRIIGADGVLETPVADKVPKPSAVKKPLPVPAVDATLGAITGSSQGDSQAPTVPAVPGTEANTALAPGSSASVANLTPQVNTATGAKNNATSGASAGQIEELVAWIVQAGSFADELNALALRDSLRQQGFPTFVTLADNGQSVVYRVKVGPMTDLVKAEASQQQIEQITGRKTLVRRYP